jgi:hypothetical protein
MVLQTTFKKVEKGQQEAYHTISNGTELNMRALPGTHVLGSVLIDRGPTDRVVIIDPLLTQLDSRDPLVPC